MHKQDFSIGNTPLIDLSALPGRGTLLAKGEYANPTGSAKDRAAWYMVKDAEKRGILPPGGTIIEPTSGNTGIGLACVAASRGYRVIIVMPDTMSMERRLIMKAYGAELVLTNGAFGISGAIKKAEEMKLVSNEVSEFEALPGNGLTGVLNGKVIFSVVHEKDMEFYGVTPQEFIDVKALQGDTADNIPGVPKIGAKTATDLISQYGSVENIYEHIEEITKKKLKESYLLQVLQRPVCYLGNRR